MRDDTQPTVAPAIILSGGSETVTSALVDEFTRHKIPFRIIHLGRNGLLKGLVPTNVYREIRWPPVFLDESISELGNILTEFDSGNRFSFPVFPTEDGGLRFLLKARDQLANRIVLNGATKLRYGGLDKAELFGFLSKSAASEYCAKTLSVRNVEDVRKAAIELGGDCIVKPSIKPFSMNMKGMKGKAIPIDSSFGGLRDLEASWSVCNTWVLQERLTAVGDEGELVWWGCYVKDEGIVASCTALELQKQPRVGGTGCWVQIDNRWKGALDEMVSKILGVLGYEGLVEIPFLQDDQGRLRMLELNPRPWLQVGLPGRCGLPLAAASFGCLSGKHETYTDTVLAGSWVSPERLLLSALSGEHGYRLPALFRAMTLIARADVRAVWDSPLPGLRSRWLRRHARKLKPRFLSV